MSNFLFWLRWKYKFSSEPPAFTQAEVGGGEENFTILFGEPDFQMMKKFELIDLLTD